MPKKIFTIIITIFSLLVIALFGAAFLIARDTGDERVAKITLREFLPFGGGSEDISLERPPIPDLGEGGGDFTIDEGGGAEVPTQRLKLSQLTSTAVAGAMLYMKDDDETIFIRYIERPLGHIFETRSQETGRTRISNTTIPAIQEALWRAGGDELVVRYLDENDVVKSFASKIILPEEGDGKIEGVFIEDDIEEIIVSPDGNRIFYLTNFGNSIIGTIADFDGKNKKQVFDFLFTEWIAGWPQAQTITLTTKPSATAEGFSYFLNTETGELDRTLADIAGLTVLASPDTGNILYSESFTGRFKTQMYNTAKKTSFAFPVSTLPEKCVWSKKELTVLYCGVPTIIPKGDYPDVWYQGIVSFADNIWRIETETGVVKILTSPRISAREEIDIIKPILSEDESRLFFINKKDSTLWSLKLR